MTPTGRALFFVLALLYATPSALAEPRRAAVVRVAVVDEALRAEADDVTSALTETLRAEGYTTEVTEVELGTIKTMLACSDLDVCLRQLGATLGVQVVVAGRLVAGADGDRSLSLLWVTDDDVYRDRVRVTVDDPELTAKTRAFARQEDYGGPAPDVADDSGLDVGDGDPLTLEGPARSKSVDWPRESWILGGAGAVAITLGALTLQSGLGRQGDIDDAPTDTVADLEALESQESSALRRSFIGTTLLVAGGAALITGAVFAVRHKQNTEPPTGLTVSLPPGALGTGVVVGVRGSL